VGRRAEGEQDGALGEVGRVASARGEHHALRDLLGHGLIAGRRVGSRVHERQSVHGAMLPAPPAAAIDRRGELHIIRTDDQSQVARSCEGMHGSRASGPDRDS